LASGTVKSYETSNGFKLVAEGRIQSPKGFDFGPWIFEIPIWLDPVLGFIHNQNFNQQLNGIITKMKQKGNGSLLACSPVNHPCAVFELFYHWEIRS
jgi:hypothetical protein